MNKENVKRILKGTGVIIASIAVAATVTTVIKTVIPVDNLTKANKVMIVIGTSIIGGMVGEAGAEYTGNFMDSILSGFFPDDPQTGLEEKV